jgi:phosphate transport system permease protein
MPSLNTAASTHADRWTGARLQPGLALKDLRPSSRRVWRNRRNAILIGLATLLVLIPVGMILAYIVAKGFRYMNLEFLTHSEPFSDRKVSGGFLNGLVGTALMVGIASAVSIPLGVLGAVYLVEYGKKNWLAKLIRFFADVMTGVPSIFVGLFVYTALVVRSTEEMLKLVPQELKDASYGLGAAKWTTITKVIIPSALPGISTGVMLAIARAAGETAPLILTALGSLQLTAKLWNSPISALPLAILQGARNPFAAGQARAWAGALELIIIVLVLTVLARVISSRSRLTK